MHLSFRIPEERDLPKFEACGCDHNLWWWKYESESFQGHFRIKNNRISLAEILQNPGITFGIFLKPWVNDRITASSSWPKNVRMEGSI